ncbi:MAG: hypothetical protein Q7U82_17460 [Gammaproteobacteria bacterium]|nr:hypothetical protein [Gammaproteobacteria bacterium]
MPSLARVPKSRITLPLSTALMAVAACSPSHADTPLGWMNSDHLNAYTLDAMKFDLTASSLAVNETIDFLNIREDLLAGTRQLEGDSGDLEGERIELQFGITSYLSAFYRRQQQNLTIDLGEIKSINLVDIDDALSTTATAYGLKWNFFESGYFDNTRAWQSASLEITRTENNTDDFSGSLDKITLSGNTTILFTQPQTFRVQDMDDEGWQARVLYSFPLGDALTTSLWAGYAETEASSGTGSDIKVTALAAAFDQSFEVEESQLLLGGGLNWQITPRIPLQLSYEYLRINTSDVTTVVNPSNVLLPSFLQANNVNKIDANDNHTLRGSISYWVTPKFNVSLTGKLFSNQFLGVIPHYNNPLSGSFSEQPYGYAGIQLGLQL